MCVRDHFDQQRLFDEVSNCGCPVAVARRDVAKRVFARGLVAMRRAPRVNTFSRTLTTVATVWSAAWGRCLAALRARCPDGPRRRGCCGGGGVASTQIAPASRAESARGILAAILGRRAAPTGRVGVGARGVPAPKLFSHLTTYPSWLEYAGGLRSRARAKRRAMNLPAPGFDTSLDGPITDHGGSHANLQRVYHY
jgi:hypothetical protein